MKKSAIAFLLLLVACGDDVTQINQNGLEVVATVGDLPKCTSSNEGEQAYVKGEPSPRICVEGEWFATKTSDDSDFSCTTKELKDGSGLKIICNGDSIGVVLNGEKGKDGKAGKDGKDGDDGKDGEDGEAGSGCSMTDRTDSTITVVCGDSTMVIELGTGADSGELEPDSERIAVSLDSLAGFSQKGPFLKGSKVFLYELSDGRTLKQTNGNFTSYITRDDGRYKFSARDLTSQYAMIEVEGNYRNEVTGKPSNAAIRLRALTDMRKRSNANVNLLTTLEFDRVYYLVTRGDKDGKKLTVKQAKAQAQKEIFGAFYIDTAIVAGSSEDLDVFGEGDGNAALLAISILLQRDTTETALTVLMTEIANGLETTGKWDDLAARAIVAKWALEVDSGDVSRLNDFRNHVNDWGLGAVPEFEKYIRRFASLESGLGICGSDSIPIGMVKNVTNEHFEEFYAEDYLDTSHKTRFICEDGYVGKWHVASDLQKDTLSWGHDANKGDVRYGQINNNLTYVYDGNYWRHGTNLDGVVGFGCLDVYKDTVLEKAGSWYKCVRDTAVWIDESFFTTAWRDAMDIEKDTVGWGHNYEEGRVQRGQITGQPYVYENKNWRLGTEMDFLLEQACMESTEWDTSTVAIEGVYYVCNPDACENYACIERNPENWACLQYGCLEPLGRQWTPAPDIYNDTYVLRDECKKGDEGNFGKDGLVPGELNSKNIYVCDAGEFRKADSIEVHGGKGCTSYNRDTVLILADQYSYYRCTENNWEFAFDSLNFGTVEDADGNVYKTVGIKTQMWMAENMRRKVDGSVCLGDDEFCEKYGLLYKWTAALDTSEEACGARRNCQITTRIQGICPDGWHIPNTNEWWDLINATGGQRISGRALKSTSGWHQEQNGTDIYGFNGLPAGYGAVSSDEPNLVNYGFITYYWSSVEYDDMASNSMELTAFDDAATSGLGGGDKRYYLSVRCLMDKPVAP